MTSCCAAVASSTPRLASTPSATSPSPAAALLRLGPGLGPAATDIDVAGHVVTAGFIDLHSHTADVAGLRLRALDGVTTALELEAGVSPVEPAYRRAEAEGRPVNYGFAASWALARMEAVAGVELDGRLGTFLANIAAPAWQGSASPIQVGAILSRLSADLADGAVGIGVLVGYAPGTDPANTCRWRLSPRKPAYRLSPMPGT